MAFPCLLPLDSCRYLDRRRAQTDDLIDLLASRQDTMRRYATGLLDRMQELGVEDGDGSGEGAWGTLHEGELSGMAAEGCVLQRGWCLLGFCAHTLADKARV